MAQVFYIGGQGKRSNIQLLKRRAAEEHAGQVCHVLVMEHFQTFNLLQVLENTSRTGTVEHIGKSASVCVLHRRIENHFLHLVGIALEPHIAFDILGGIELFYAIVRAAQVVIMIFERTRRFVEHGVGLRDRGEIAGFAAAQVDAGVGLVDVVFAVARGPGDTYQRMTFFEQIMGLCQRLACAPVVVAIDGLQVKTAVEHVLHRRRLDHVKVAEVNLFECVAVFEHGVHALHFPGVETAQVERRERLATEEHSVHICYILRVEPAQVNILQCGTLIEHTIHRFHFVRDEVAHALDGSHFPESFEHSVHRSEPCIFHRSVNDCLCHLVFIVLETFGIRIVYRIVWFGSFSCCRTDETLGIVVIRQCSGRRIESGVEIFLFGEVTRVALFIRTGVGSVGMVLVKRRSVAADKRRAAREHFL